MSGEPRSIYTAANRGRDRAPKRVLTGICGDVVDVNDPLSGRRLRWSREEFELMWKRLGDRALAL